MKLSDCPLCRWVLVDIGGPAGDGGRAGIFQMAPIDALLKDGASLTGVTVMVKLWLALASLPPFAVPPLSLEEKVTVALPLALSAGA